MSFLNPYYLSLLIPLVILYIYRPKNLKDSIKSIILFLIILSLSRPILKEEKKSEMIESKDIIIAFDLSFSMMADDIYPNRYEYAKESIREILKSNLNDNIMLIGFTTNPLLLSPPTTDHRVVATALDSINREYILTRGTSLKRLFEKVSTISMRDRNLILITDGGEERDLEGLSKILESGNITLTILALGTKGGTTVKKSSGELLRDSSGDLVISRVNPILKQLVEINGGEYIKASLSPKEEANRVIDIIESRYKSQEIEKDKMRFIELYQIPLFIATILFLILYTRAIKYLIILISLFSSQSEASILDNIYLSFAYKNYNIQDYNSTIKYIKEIDTQSLESKIILANSHYRLYRYKKAIEVYKSIKSRDIDIKSLLYYNIGNCYSRLKDYKRAREFYIKSLWLKEDSDTLYNLSLIIKSKNSIDALSKLAKPSSKNSSSSDSLDSDSDSKDRDKSSGSGGGGKSDKSSKKEDEKRVLIETKATKKQPVSSKVYDLINKGYINEKEPW